MKIEQILLPFDDSVHSVNATNYALKLAKLCGAHVTIVNCYEWHENIYEISGRVLIIMFTALAFGQLLTINNIPDLIAQGLLNLTDNLYMIWALIIFFLLFMGMFMETLATIMLVTPVLLPVMVSLGVDPIHFGVVLVCCCEIGFATPPLGENMFIASGVARTTLEDISVNALPFVFVSVFVVFLIAYLPGLTLWLPNVLNTIFQ